MYNSTPSSPIVETPVANDMMNQYVAQPSSSIEPPSPPPTEERFPQAERILEHFRDIECGHRKLCGEQSWIDFQLADGEFDEMVRRLERDPDLNGYVNDKIRYDYDYYTRQFAIRMACDLHEAFRVGLRREIWRWIEGLAPREDNVGVFARGIDNTEGEPSYKFPPTLASDDYTNAQAIRTPDMPFRHEEDRLPGTIVEIASSQKHKDLRRLAYTYLVYSNAAVQVVVGFNLKYGSTKRATFSVWRSKDEGDMLSMVTECSNQEFRSVDGQPSSHDPLRFRLQDFAMDETAKAILGTDDEELNITMDQLCGFLSKAERNEENKKSGGLREKTTGKRKLPLEETPERVITAEEEDESDRQEARAAKRASVGDRAYSGPRQLATGLPRRRSARLGSTSQDS